MMGCILVGCWVVLMSFIIGFLIIDIVQHKRHLRRHEPPEPGFLGWCRNKQILSYVWYICLILVLGVGTCPVSIVIALVWPGGSGGGAIGEALLVDLLNSAPIFMVLWSTAAAAWIYISWKTIRSFDPNSQKRGAVQSDEQMSATTRLDELLAKLGFKGPPHG